MRAHHGMVLVGLAVCLLVVGCEQPAGRTRAVELPLPAAQALGKAYPQASVQKVTGESERGEQWYEVTLLKDGAELKVILLGDGTILEVESPLAVKELPEVVADAVAKAAPGAKVEGVRKQEVLAGANLKKFPSPKVRYEVEVEQGDKEGEMALAGDGAVLEGLKWEKVASDREGQNEEADNEEDDDDAAKPESSATQASHDFRSEFPVDKAGLADSGESRYVILTPGYRLTYQDGKDTLTITVLEETKVVDGVKTRVVEERETKGGQLAEVSRNYFAIDRKTKDVYYFGEDVDTYKDGKVVAHEGSWQSGRNGAKFGLMMPGEPKVGDRYCQEMAPKVAMDRAQVASVTEEVTVPAGTFKNCLKTKESSALERGAEEKLYAPGVGLLKDGGFQLARIEKPRPELPAAVAKAFRDAFPKAEIEKVDLDEENDVTVYDIEFKNGKVEQETDIAADGTILEVTLVVEAKAVPAAATKAIEKAAEGAKITRIEHIDIRYETKDGKPVKLAKPVTHFAAEFTKGDRTTEVVVTPDGTLVKE